MLDCNGARVLFAAAGAKGRGNGMNLQGKPKFDRVFDPPHAVSALKEVHVNEAAKNLTIAVLTTIVDAAVVVWFGGVIWQALSPIIWSRILILLLAGLWALSLARIWACSIYSLRRGRRSRSFGLTSGTAITSIDLRGEGDV
jgi:hypothetical protein